MNKFVYNFKHGNKDMKKLLGGKGANLAEMINIGLNVPGGFTVTTEACNMYYEKNQQLWPELKTEILNELTKLEEETKKTFGHGENPLLVSVRSGAVFSMPGMMDTILNLGLNDETVLSLASKSQNERFAYDSYRRFIQMFADVALDVPKSNFEYVLDQLKRKRNVENDTELDVEDLKELVSQYKEIYIREVGEAFPQDPKKQLELAITAVFESWNNPRAKIYRDLHEIAHNLGTAVNIQSMVYGNMGEKSGTGVAFTRNPSTGENKVFGEFLLNAQGEDVVAGIRTPKDILELKSLMPKVYEQFIETTKILENHYHDMQDIEFTIEDEELFLLQTRTGKRTAKAAINIAVDLVNEGKISKAESIQRIKPQVLEQLLHPTFDPKELVNYEQVAKGLAASPGAASGEIRFCAEDVVNAKGIDTILVRQETSPDDITGMIDAKGILTARGGMTSHAAVVARGMGKCCVAGCQEITVNENEKTIIIGDLILHEGDVISIDGASGIVYLGAVPKTDMNMIENFDIFMDYVDEFKKMEVRANADNPQDAKKALELGARGIGLCRTEHMFFDEKRIFDVRRMIVAETKTEREAALQSLLPYQREDFIGIYQELGELPATIRLLDPPLHEFLPHTQEDIEKLAEGVNKPVAQLKQIIAKLQEFNPMLGHRGCRLAITYPEIYQMQVRAIIEAALIVADGSQNIVPEIMIPLVCAKEELAYIKISLEQEIETIFKEQGKRLEYKIGSMIEVPRAALTAGEIATESAFFSFGTNDLTQMGFGFSRDDAGKFLEEYANKKIFASDPFTSLDQSGIGRLIEIACTEGKVANPNLKIGICGEHGGDPKTIAFCQKQGLDYVSCSPFRVPIARLAAAQANIQELQSNLK